MSFTFILFNVINVICNDTKLMILENLINFIKIFNLYNNCKYVYTVNVQ